MNADEAAAALAVGLGADRILFLTDVPGVIVDGRLATVLPADEAEAGARRGPLRGRDRPGSWPPCARHGAVCVRRSAPPRCRCDGGK